MLRRLLPAEASLEWKVWWAAVEKWAREVWIAARRKPRAFPQDALLEGELEWAHAVVSEAAAGGSAGSIGKAWATVGVGH